MAAETYIRRVGIRAESKPRKQSALWVGASHHTGGQGCGSTGITQACAFPRHWQSIPLSSVPLVLSREENLSEGST